MTDSQNVDGTTAGSRTLTYTAVLLPLAVLAFVATGILSTGDLASAQTNDTDNATRLADIDESYFADVDASSQDTLAQGMLEPRSDSNDEADAAPEDESEENAEDQSDASSDDPQVSGDRECSQAYLSDDLRIDFNNDREEVLKLQSFLKTFADYDYVGLTGTFDENTLRAVEAFQTRYAEDVLEPWGYEASEATGYVYITTKQKINEIYCDEQFLLSNSQQEEIRSYRQMLNQWRAQGASFETPNYLANYWAGSNAGNVAGENDDPATEDASSDDGDTMNENDSSEDADSTEDASTTATSSTSSDDDGGGFFDWLFGGNDDEETTTDEAATTTEEATTSDDETATDADSEEDADEEEGSSVVVEETPATDTAATETNATSATSSVDGLAAGVFTGVNSIFDFIFSPTFLLVILVILILLLIATLVDTSPEEIDPEDGDESGNVDEEAEVEESDDAEDTEVENEPSAGDDTDNSYSDSDASSEQSHSSKDSTSDSSNRSSGSDRSGTDQKRNNN